VFQVQVEKATRSAQTPADAAALLAGFAHEVNNPLDSLLNLLYLTECEATFTTKGHHYLTLAKEEVNRVSQIARRVLTEFRGAAIPQDTNVPNLLRSVVDFYESRFEARGISIQTRYCPDGEFAVYPGPLRQAFSNLLLNAADAMPTGGRMHARVASAHEWSGQERRGLRLTFADHGGGIAAENLPRIFELFFTTKGTAGTGLGLSLVQDVVKKHDGVLRVRSSTRPGHTGTVFAVFLPVP
jgi:signal transduction histidine kinase